MEKMRNRLLSSILALATLTCAVLPGDADGNNNITPFDAVIILRYLASWDVTLG